MDFVDRSIDIEVRAIVFNDRSMDCIDARTDFVHDRIDVEDAACDVVDDISVDGAKKWPGGEARPSRRRWSSPWRNPGSNRSCGDQAMVSSA
ncbi:MAG: hypothetical protein IPO95_13165 [Rhodanobacteraceae bacterium]|nr:hypothetical protein [Rhodanobacteraceae bacterium]